MESDRRSDCQAGDDDEHRQARVLLTGREPSAGDHCGCTNGQREILRVDAREHRRDTEGLADAEVVG